MRESPLILHVPWGKRYNIFDLPWIERKERGAHYPQKKGRPGGGRGAKENNR